MLLLDEPSLGLAPNLLGNVFKKLVEINNELELSMLIVEQKVLEVLEISDRVYSIKLGRVAFEGKPEELKGNKQEEKQGDMCGFKATICFHTRICLMQDDLCLVFLGHMIFLVRG